MQSLICDDVYLEVTIDGKLNLVDHLTGRIIENGHIKDIYPSFKEEKQKLEKKKEDKIL